jgi:ribosomal protein L11 methyltransferase
MQNSVQITIEKLNPEQIEILIALLNEEGYTGFEETEGGLKAFVDESEFDEEQLKQIIHTFTDDFRKELIAPKNWNAQWEKEYAPVVVHNFAAVRAHFHEPVKNVQYEIKITPKMSFGTGHHATTWQMMDLMQQIDFSNRHVFDFGTGTGVLAILAQKMGASKVLAMDNDDWSIENTIENCTKNQADKVEIRKADAPPAGVEFDSILANINRHILLANMNAMSSVLKTGGKLLMSGFYTGENQLLIEAAKAVQLELLHSSERNEWSCLMFQKTDA